MISLQSWMTRIRRQTPLQLILIVPFVLQIIAVVGLVGWFSFRNGHQAVNAVASQLHQEITARVEQTIQDYLRVPPLINQLNTDNIHLGLMDVEDPEMLEQYFLSQIKRFDSVSNIYWGNPQGGIVLAGRLDDGTLVIKSTDQFMAGEYYTYSVNEQGYRQDVLNVQSDFDVRTRLWYQKAVEAEDSIWSDLYLFSNENLGISASQPVYDGAGNLLGVLAVDLKLSQLNNFIQGMTVGETGQLFLMNRTGHLIASSTGEEPFLSDPLDSEQKRLFVTNSRESLTRLTANYLEEKFGTFADISAEQQLEIDAEELYFLQVAPFTYIEDIHWLIVVVIPESDFMGQINTTTQMTIMLSVLAVIAAILVGIITSRWIVQPILALNQAAKALAQGEWNHPFDIERQDELGQLARSFESMADQLQESFEALENKNADLQSLNAELERLDDLKDEFLANTSHELRTPLTGIIGLAESLIDGVAGPMESEQRRNLTMIVTSGRRLANLVDDILDFSKLKHHSLTLRLKPMRLHTLVEVILKLTEPMIDPDEVRLINSVSPDAPPVSADENRIQQILHNLVGNAAKFTSSGTIEVSAQSEQDGYLTVIVSDTGIGIVPEKTEQIFLPFEQADGSIAREYGGTGLGLTVTKQLVELHGGEITVESVVSQGTEVAFTLPISEAQPEDITLAEEEMDATIYKEMVLNEQSMLPLFVDVEPTVMRDIQFPTSEGEYHILVVDDEPINRQVLINQLSLYNYQITTAANGMEALDILQEGKAHFDLIILDVMMPRMSGYEVCREIRQYYPITDLPIIMLTAKHQISNLVAGFDAGANDYLTKPFSRVELLVRIKTHLQLTDLREMNVSKDKFFSIVAHDLRGPFSPLLSMSKFLSNIAREASPSEIKQLSAVIHRSAQNVYNLLENLLQWSRVQGGRMPFDPSQVNLKAIADQCLLLLETNASDKGINLQNSIPEESTIYADENMLDTILRNLVSNALKFTSRDGSVTISAQSKNASFMEIAVSDTGIGINEENVKRLFDLRQHHSTLGTARENGTGLGLIICKEMVKHHGGRIWVESQVGKGTSVRFTVPHDPSSSLRSSAGEEEEQNAEKDTSTKEELPMIEETYDAPPPKEMATLKELALMGDLLGIQEQADHLEAMDERYVPFAQKLRDLALDFEEQALLDFVEQYSSPKKAHS